MHKQICEIKSVDNILWYICTNTSLASVANFAPINYQWWICFEFISSPGEPTSLGLNGQKFRRVFPRPDPPSGKLMLLKKTLAMEYFLCLLNCCHAPSWSKEYVIRLMFHVTDRVARENAKAGRYVRLLRWWWASHRGESEEEKREENPRVWDQTLWRLWI